MNVPVFFHSAQLVLGDEGEFCVAFGDSGVECGEFAAALMATHGNEEFVGKISAATNSSQ